MALLHFDPASHKYTLNGSILPSVTECIRGSNGNRYQNRAMVYGTEVHACIGNYLLGQPIAAPPYRDFCSEAGKIASNTTEVEKMGHYLALFAGTADCICMINGIRTVVDWKIRQGNTPLKKAPWHYRLQVAAYAKMFDCAQGMVVQMRQWADTIEIRKDIVEEIDLHLKQTTTPIGFWHRFIRHQYKKGNSLQSIHRRLDSLSVDYIPSAG